MKIKIEIMVYSILLLLILSCSSDQKGENVNPILLLDLQRDYVRMWCGTTYSVNIVSNGQYQIESTVPSVVDVSLKGSVIVIRANTPGEAQIRISDPYDKNNSKVIYCYSRVFSGYWSENEELLRFYKNSPQVVSNNKPIADNIRKELLEKSYKRYGSLYYFDDTTNEVTVFLPYISPNERYTGTYTWDWKNRVLSLTFNNTTETYKCDLMPPLSGSIAPPFTLSITQDFTDKYVNLYPEAGIKEASITRYIIAHGDCWWNDKEER